MSCGVGRRRSLDLALLWLGCRPAAVAPIWPLAWEPPCAAGAAQKKKKKKKKKKIAFLALLHTFMRRQGFILIFIHL